MFETWYKMIGLDLTLLITHRLSADEFGHGFELMRQGACGKVVLDWT